MSAQQQLAAEYARDSAKRVAMYTSKGMGIGRPSRHEVFAPPALPTPLRQPADLDVSALNEQGRLASGLRRWVVAGCGLLGPPVGPVGPGGNPVLQHTMSATPRPGCHVAATDRCSDEGYLQHAEQTSLTLHLAEGPDAEPDAAAALADDTELRWPPRLATTQLQSQLFLKVIEGIEEYTGMLRRAAGREDGSAAAVADEVLLAGQAQKTFSQVAHRVAAAELGILFAASVDGQGLRRAEHRLQCVLEEVACSKAKSSEKLGLALGAYSQVLQLLLEA